MSCYPKPSRYSRNKIKVQLDLNNYETIPEVTKATGVDTPKFAEKANLAK